MNTLWMYSDLLQHCNSNPSQSLEWIQFKLDYIAVQVFLIYFCMMDNQTMSWDHTVTADLILVLSSLGNTEQNL